VNHEELFTAIYTAQVAHVRAVATARVRRDDRDLVEDLVQEAFLRLWVYLERGNTVANPAGLLNTLVRRAAIDHYRRARNTRERATDLTDPLAARCAPPEPSAEDIAMLHADIERLLAESVAEVAA
jgi:RNA polymerase sigma factor (sigma-70 family)